MRLGTSIILACALAAVTGGCGDDAPLDVPEDTTYAAKSGSRLKARYFVDDEGARVFAGWFDQQRNEPCRVARGEGGRYYCFPFGNPALYADARCRQPLGVHGGCAARYTATPRGDIRCDNETMALWEEGGPIELPSQYRWGGDSCLASAPSPSGVVAATTRLPDSELVTGEATQPRADLRLGSRMVRFTDGAEAPFALIDARWKQRCKPVATSEGVRCVPESAVYAGLGPYFGDRSCAAMVAHADAPACLAPMVGLQAAAAGCPNVTGAFLLGPRLDPREVFSGAECQRGRLLPGHFYMMGAPLELTAFPALLVTERGRGRIRARTFAAGDGVPAPQLGVRLLDTSMNVECRVVPASDGALRCLPLDGPALPAADAGARYADAACTVALARVDGRADCATAAAPPTMVARAVLQACPELGAGAGALEPTRWDIHRLGPVHEGAVYLRDGAGCTMDAPAAQGETFHALGEVIEPSAFAAFRQE